MLAVVIPARNAAPTIGAQLDALGDDHPVIVVIDHAEVDATEAIALARGAQVVRSARTGINAARNAGVRATSADRIALCDADDVVGPGWAKAMDTALDDHDVVCGRVDLATLNTERIRSCHDLTEDAPIGANMAFRRSVWDAIRGFDEAFLRGNDEIDFLQAAEMAGFTFGRSDDAVVAYRLRDDWRQAMRVARWNMISKAQMRAKHGPPQPWKAAARNAAIVASHTLSVSRCTTYEGRWRWLMDVARVAGTWDAWRQFRIVTSAPEPRPRPT